MPKSYRPWTPDQPYLLAPNPRDWLPEGHLARFVLEVVEVLDVSSIEDPIQDKDPRGERPYDPRMMVSLLLYGYCTGVFSSRKLERRTYEDVACRYLAGGQHPDFTTLCAFRRTHLAALEGVFVQLVQVARRAGLAKLGHVSFDGTKVEANASKHKAMSYERMKAAEARLEEEVRLLLQRAESQDASDDARLGTGVCETDLPGELRRREERLERIRKARAELLEEARSARAAQLREQAARANEIAASAPDDSTRERARARALRREGAAEALDPAPEPAAEEPPEPPEAQAMPDDLPRHRPKVTRQGTPKPKAQRNFTDSDSRIMERGGYVLQGYNCQAGVDADHQIIVAQGVSNQPPDTHYLVPMVQRVEGTTGSLPTVITADAGYWAPVNAAWCEQRGVDAYISTRRESHGVSAASRSTPPVEPSLTPQQRMRAKVASPEGRKLYQRRKCIPEPVFGQIKQAMGFRRFSNRGMEKVRGEWALVCACHNLRKLWAVRAAGRLVALG